MANIRLQSVNKTFGDATVILSLSLDIADGEFLVLLGPSGCAKSTTLRLLAGLESITDGEIHIDGVCVNQLTPKERGIAMVFQNYALYPHMTVYDNIAFSLKIAKLPKDEIRNKVMQTADILQLTPLLARFPAALSGGQRQRVAIGRAMVRNPKVFLFDEPLSNLDAKLRNTMRAEIKLLHETLKSTMVYVTHDQVEAMTLADRIAVMEKGHLVQLGTPQQIYQRPANRFVATFIGSPAMNILPVTRDGNLLRGPGVYMNVDVAANLPAKLELGIRPNHLQLCGAAEAHIQGRVKLVEYLGNELVLHLTLDDGTTVVVQTGDEQPVSHGDHIHLRVPDDRYFLFDAATGDTVRYATHQAGA